MAQKVEVKITADRMEEVVTVDEFIALQESRSMKVIRSVVAKFILGEDGEYLPTDEGEKIVGQMTVKQLKEVMKAFQFGVEEIVPKQNSATSD